MIRFMSLVALSCLLSLGCGERNDSVGKRIDSAMQALEHQAQSNMAFADTLKNHTGRLEKGEAERAELKNRVNEIQGETAFAQRGTGHDLTRQSIPLSHTYALLPVAQQQIANSNPAPQLAPVSPAPAEPGTTVPPRQISPAVAAFLAENPDWFSNTDKHQERQDDEIKGLKEDMKQVKGTLDDHNQRIANNTKEIEKMHQLGKQTDSVAKTP